MAGIDNLKPVDSKRAAEIGALGGSAKKGSKHLSTWIQQLLNDEEFEAQVLQGMKIVEFKGAPIKAIVKAQMIKAINGDVKAFDVLGKYGYGTKQEIEHSGSVDTGISDPVIAAEFQEFLENKTKQ